MNITGWWLRFIDCVIGCGLWFGVTVMVSANSDANRSPLNIAVAANFYATAEQLANEFTANTGIESHVLQGSSGKLFAQIRQGAPFDVFLSADEQRIEDLLALTLVHSPIIYAQGQLALVASGSLTFSDFVQGNFARIAIANAKLAPYGMAAEEVLTHYRLLGAKPKGGLFIHKTPTPFKLVIGQSALQTYQFVASNNVDFALIPMSYALESDKTYWSIAPELYTPLRQAGAIVSRTQKRVLAEAFMAYLQSPQAAKIMRQRGYVIGKASSMAWVQE